MRTERIRCARCGMKVPAHAMKVHPEWCVERKREVKGPEVREQRREDIAEAMRNRR